MSLSWLLPIEKIPATVGGPVLMFIGLLGLFSEPVWGGCVIAVGVVICLYAFIKSRNEANNEQINTSINKNNDD